VKITIMNRVDFNTLPAGFPLESDATLGFMQGNLIDAIEGLAAMMGEPAPGTGVILSGCEVTGGTMSDGWILYNDGGTYEVLFFEGGSVGATFLIQQTTVSKSNQDGTSVARYYTRKAVFGGGGGAINFSNLARWRGIAVAAAGIQAVAAGGEYSSTDWVILSGLEPVSGGSGGITAGRAAYGGRAVEVSSYGSPVSSGSPIYLKTDGTWTPTSGGGALQFNPWTARHVRTLMKNKMHPVGSILWLKNGVSDLTTYFSTGLGFHYWQGWAIADGTNSTLNLSAAITGVTAVQRIS
jgi:hypothetical protein